MFIGLNYRYNFGFVATHQQKVTLTLDNPDETRNFDIDINGTSHALEIGIKYNLGVF